MKHYRKLTAVLCALVCALQLLLPAFAEGLLPYIPIISSPVTRIEMTKQPTKTTFFVGDDIDVTGAQITLTHENGKTESYPVQRSWCGDIDNYVAGKVTVYVDYPNRQGYTGANPSFTVTFVTPAVSSLRIDTPPKKTSYYSGEELDIAGLAVMASFSNGSSWDVTDELTFSGFDTKKPGKQTVTAAYTSGGKKFTTSFVVTVTALAPVGAEIMQMPSRVQYYEGEALDLGGLVLGIRYNDGTVVSVNDLSEITAEGYVPTVIGDQKITVSCRGTTAELTVRTLISPVHTHVPGEYRTISEPTCETDGSKCANCTVCGEIADTVILPKLGHSFSDFAVTLEPAVGTAGERVRTCSVCQKTEREELPCLNRDLVSGDVTASAVRYSDGSDTDPFPGGLTLSALSLGADQPDAETIRAAQYTDASGQNYCLEYLNGYLIGYEMSGIAAERTGETVYTVLLPESAGENVLPYIDGKEPTGFEWRREGNTLRFAYQPPEGSKTFRLYLFRAEPVVETEPVTLAPETEPVPGTDAGSRFSDDPDTSAAPPSASGSLGAGRTVLIAASALAGAAAVAVGLMLLLKKKDFDFLK